MRKRLTPLKCHIVRGKDFLSLSRSGCLQLTSSATLTSSTDSALLANFSYMLRRAL